MKPPLSLDVRDRHKGLTVQEYEERPMHFDGRRWVWGMVPSDTVWEPWYTGDEKEGSLAGYDEQSFYQTNNNVTRALYWVEGQEYPVVVWFDNTTGERIA